LDRIDSLKLKVLFGQTLDFTNCGRLASHRSGEAEALHLLDFFLASFAGHMVNVQRSCGLVKTLPTNDLFLVARSASQLFPLDEWLFGFGRFGSTDATFQLLLNLGSELLKLPHFFLALI
jgi:hypothetical protein